MFAEIALIDFERCAKNGDKDDELDPINNVLEKWEPGEAHGEIAHFSGDSEAEKNPVDDDGHEEVPEDEPVAALEIGITANAGRGGDLGEIGVGGSVSVEVIRR